MEKKNLIIGSYTIENTCSTSSLDFSKTPYTKSFVAASKLTGGNKKLKYISDHSFGQLLGGDMIEEDDSDMELKKIK